MNYLKKPLLRGIIVLKSYPRAGDSAQLLLPFLINMCVLSSQMNNTVDPINYVGQSEINFHCHRNKMSPLSFSDYLLLIMSIVVLRDEELFFFMMDKQYL